MQDWFCATPFPFEMEESMAEMEELELALNKAPPNAELLGVPLPTAEHLLLQALPPSTRYNSSLILPKKIAAKENIIFEDNLVNLKKMSRREDINSQRRARERNRYSRFTPEQRQHKIQSVLHNRKRKRNGSNTVVNCNVGCLFSDGVIEQPFSSRSLHNERPSVVTGQPSFQPQLSQLHELRAVPPCSFCHAKKFQYESRSFCCYNGQVVLANEGVPKALRTLFTSQNDEGLEFRRHIRAYNSMFAFTSFGVKRDKELATSRQGVYTFRAQGQVYHDLPSLIPSGDSPCYFQLYFYDTDNELQNRLSILGKAPLDKCVVKKLMEVLSGNPYSQVLRKLQQDQLDSYQIRIRSDVKLDQRVYNSPSADQDNTRVKLTESLRHASGKTYIFWAKLDKMNDKDRTFGKIIAEEVQNDEDSESTEATGDLDHNNKTKKRIKVEKD
ncbi:hypothetical protein Vadar_019830 [Vaccinium darrowii]|uniref:Uncharacterized protein n=1 Tax=Vaccinium darrowii TaxID=229202 RepID=A0ACB7Z587_9ERIC|nr:hypothetical protein Vadar_019830 [Vaccinium darrowii]